MKRILMLAVLAAGLTACSDDSVEKKVAAPAALTVSQAEILSFVPAQSPLLGLGGLSFDQLPQGYKDAMEKYMESTKTYMSSMIDQGLESIITKGGKDAEHVQNKIKPFVDKWLVNGDWANLGFEMGQTQYALYAVDLFPVLRLKLADGHKMEQMLSDLTSEFNLPFQISDVSGIKLRETGNHQLTFMVALDNDYLVVTAAPTPIKDQLVNRLLGVDKPTISLMQDQSALRATKTKHQFVLDDLFILDIAKMADYFINPSKHNSVLLNFLQVEDNMLSASCKTEFTDIIANMPRLVAGMTSVTDDSYGISMIFETSTELGTDLSQLAGRIPQNNQNSAISFGLSFDILAAKKLAQKYAQALVDSPYQCEHLTLLNQNAHNILAQVSQPLPPMVSNFKGISYSLEGLKLNPAAVDSGQPEKIVENIQAQMLVAVDNPDALMGMAQMMLPQLAEIELNTDGTLIHLGDKLPVSGKDIPFSAEHLFGAMSDHAIGLSIGHPDGGDLSQLVRSDGETKLMSFTATGAGYKDIMQQIFAMAEMPGMPEDIKKDLMIQKDVVLNTIFWKKASAGINFTNKGLVIDSTVDF